VPVIEVVEYDARWPDLFADLRNRYSSAFERALVPVVAIEHVGSTAVPGLAGKPVIDVDVVVDADHVAPATAVLEHLGFRALGELGMPERWAFKEPGCLPRTNTYVVVADSLALKNHLCVRDVLRADPDLRDECSSVKREVGATATDIYEYGQGKSAMTQRILARGGLSEQERDSIASNQVPGPEVPR
jgi:GrpB-like predicted nucleotidyltransferase (UPF0157 family)